MDTIRLDPKFEIMNEGFIITFFINYVNPCVKTWGVTMSHKLGLNANCIICLFFHKSHVMDL